MRLKLYEDACYNALIRQAVTASDFLKELAGKTVLITGAGGMIGSCIADLLMNVGEIYGKGCRVIAVSRNAERLAERFGGYKGREDFVICAQDISKGAPDVDCRADYVINAASSGDPVSFAKYPVDIMTANFIGSYNMLEFCRRNGTERYLYVSSGEFYGQPDENYSDFTEDYVGPLDYSTSRVCYPEGKRSGEALSSCFAAQYGVDTVTVRPCHIFGPTMTSSDSRAVAQFFRNAVRGENIVLKSAGAVERSQCFVVNAAAAILFVLLRGVSGEAYNISDPKCQMTIRELASVIAEAGGGKLVFENPDDVESKGFGKIARQVLSSEKLFALGWKPLYDLDFEISQTLEVLRNISDE